jgi:hypothetical protein
MVYAAKCYWPGITETELERRLADAGAAGYLGSLLFPDDDLVLCLFDARSRAAVQQASERVGIPCERIMASRWLPGSGKQAPSKGR